MIRCLLSWSTAPTRHRSTRRRCAPGEPASFWLPGHRARLFSSWVLFLRFGCAGPLLAFELLAFELLAFELLAFERFTQFIEAGFPQVAIPPDPGVELAEGLGPERIQPPRTFGSHADEAGV